MTDTMDSAVARYEKLRKDELRLQFNSFHLKDAWQVGTYLVELGVAAKLPISISIFFGEQRVFHCALDGATADNDDWLDRKFRVVGRFASSSLAVGARFRARGRDFRTDSNLDPNKFAAAGGALPLMVRGSMVGIIGVSGLNEQEDHDLVVKALEHHLLLH